jgi:hypothetical protein
MSYKPEYHRQYYLANRETVLAKAKLRYRANIKKFKARDNAWRQANRDARNLAQRFRIKLAEARAMLEEKNASASQTHTTGIVPVQQPAPNTKRGADILGQRGQGARA